MYIPFAPMCESVVRQQETEEFFILKFIAHMVKTNNFTWRRIFRETVFQGGQRFFILGGNFLGEILLGGLFSLVIFHVCLKV